MYMFFCHYFPKYCQLKMSSRLLWQQGGIRSMDRGMDSYINQVGRQWHIYETTEIAQIAVPIIDEHLAISFQINFLFFLLYWAFVSNSRSISEISCGQQNCLHKPPDIYQQQAIKVTPRRLGVSLHYIIYQENTVVSYLEKTCLLFMGNC